MKTFLLTVCLAAALVVSVALAAVDQAQNRKLQQAIDLIETAGAPDRATPLLEEAATGPDPIVAARALLYLARVQERQSADLARLTYERIVADFSSVGDVAAEAGRRLAATAPEVAQQSPALVCELCGDLYGSISADGRLLATIQPLMNEGDVGVLDLASQQLTPLQVQGSRQSGGSLTGAALFPAFSPDSSQIAYFWAQGRTAPAELRITARQSGAPARTLASFQPGVDLNMIAPISWLASGDIIAAITRPDQKMELHAVSTTDGTMRQIKSLDWRTVPRAARDASVSADGRFVAYRALAENPSAPVNAQQARSMEQQIYLLVIADGSEVALTGGAGQKKAPVWTPDGRHVLYLSDVSGAWDLWAVPVGDGRAAGSPMLVRKNIGDVVSFTVSNSGTYYYYEGRNGVFRASVATLTPGAASGALVTDRVIGGLATWSPDSTQLALTRNRPDGQGVDLVVHTLEGGVERVYQHAGLADRAPVWFPDGRGLLVVAGVGESPAFFRIDVNSGAFERLTTRRDESVMNDPRVKALSPDGRTLYQAAFRDSSAQILDRIVALDLQSGTYRDVYRFTGSDDSLPNNAQNLAIALSPDGRMLALNWRDRAAAALGPDAAHLAAVSVDGSGFHEITAPYRATNLFNKLAWSRDGQWIYFTTRVGNDDDDIHRIMRIRPSGGAPEAVGVEAAGLASFDPAPDGRRIAFYTLRPEGAGELIWTLDVGSILGNR